METRLNNLPLEKDKSVFRGTFVQLPVEKVKEYFFDTNTHKHQRRGKCLVCIRHVPNATWASCLPTTTCANEFLFLSTSIVLRYSKPNNSGWCQDMVFSWVLNVWKEVSTRTWYHRYPFPGLIRLRSFNLGVQPAGWFDCFTNVIHGLLTHWMGDLSTHSSLWSGLVV